MENNIYQMYNSKTIKSKECIEIQLGKQKKKKFKDTSVFFNNESFVPLEKTLWNNFREYQPYTNVKISSKEWIKIIKGFKKLSVSLKENVFQDELQYQLGFISSEDKQQYESDFGSINRNIDDMLLGFIAWIEPLLQNNDFITICGK